MLQKTGCTRIISQDVFAPVIKAVGEELRKQGSSLQYDELPSLPKIWPQFGGDVNETVEPFPTSTESPSKEDIVFYLHSSGSTGLPKPIPQRQITVLHNCRSREFPLAHTLCMILHTNFVVSLSPICA